MRAVWAGAAPAINHRARHRPNTVSIQQRRLPELRYGCHHSLLRSSHNPASRLTSVISTVIAPTVMSACVVGRCAVVVARIDPR